jgi:hypothetical protein
MRDALLSICTECTLTKPLVEQLLEAHRVSSDHAPTSALDSQSTPVGTVGPLPRNAHTLPSDTSSPGTSGGTLPTLTDPSRQSFGVDLRSERQGQVASSPSAIVHSFSERPRRAGRLPSLIAIAGCVVLSATGAGWVVRARAARDKTRAPELGATTAVLEPSVQRTRDDLPKVGQPPVAPTASPGSSDLTRTVSVRVSPDGVVVFVDSVPTTAVSGAVEVHGAPGSIHQVRLVVGKLETTSAVVITDSGPLPTSVTLNIPRPQSPKPAPHVGAATATATAASHNVPAKPSATSFTLQKSFE